MRKLTIYSKAKCPACMMTKRKLNELGVDYQEKRVDINEIYLQEVKDLGFQSLPVVVAGKDSWSGFRPDKLKELAK